jgi:hypothetical protein
LRWVFIRGVGRYSKLYLNPIKRGFRSGSYQHNCAGVSTNNCCYNLIGWIFSGWSETSVTSLLSKEGLFNFQNKPVSSSLNILTVAVLYNKINLKKLVWQVLALWNQTHLSQSNCEIINISSSTLMYFFKYIFDTF